MFLVALIIVIAVAVVVLFMNSVKFGSIATGTQLERIKKSPHYRDGKFQNISFTPDLKEGVSYFTVIRKFFFGRSKRSKPSIAIPAVTVDLHTLADNSLVWFGHSSYFMKVDGRNILVDPVLSGHASPCKDYNQKLCWHRIYNKA